MALIETEVPILDEYGYPCNFGWAKKPLFQYSHVLAEAPGRKIYGSDRYIIFSPQHLIHTEILDGGLMGFAAVTVASFKNKTRSSLSIVNPLPLGSFDLPDSSESGSIKIQRSRFVLDFVAMAGGARILKVDIPKFSHNRGLRGAVVLTPPGDGESIVTNLPWREEKSAFQYTRRSPWYTAEGVMQFAGQELVFTKGSAWGIFDWNRGVRPRRDVRFWAAGSGLAGERHISFSVGYGSADNSFATENAFFVDGKLHKLDQVTFQINPSYWLDKWNFTSNDGRLKMEFTPIMERSVRHQFFFHTHRRRQVFGNFSGIITLDGGEEIAFQNIVGMGERKKTRF
jgi:hypothetical protein